MGGDIAETVIETGRSWLPDCIIFGDSFTNALETALYCSFDTTVALDFRHNKARTIYDYIEEYKPDVVICPVSYTHLHCAVVTVLAQNEYIARRRSARMQFCFIEHYYAAIEAVSYTHLDVYKRQV